MAHQRVGTERIKALESRLQWNRRLLSNPNITAEAKVVMMVVMDLMSRGAPVEASRIATDSGTVADACGLPEQVVIETLHSLEEMRALRLYPLD